MSDHQISLKKPIEVLSLYPSHDGTLRGLLASRAQRDPNRPFLIFKDRTWNWGEFQDTVERTAQMLLSRGIGKGDRFCIMAPNSDAYVLLFFALARVGAILIPVNPDFGLAEAGYVLKHAEVSAVACTPNTLTVVRQACADMKALPLFMLLEGQAEEVPSFDDLVKSAPRPHFPTISARPACAGTSISPTDWCSPRS